jgi:hypothetical protein
LFSILVFLSGQDHEKLKRPGENLFTNPTKTIERNETIVNLTKPERSAAENSRAARKRELGMIQPG